MRTCEAVFSFFSRPVNAVSAAPPLPFGPQFALLKFSTFPIITFSWALSPGRKVDHVTIVPASGSPGHQASVICGLELAFRSVPAPG